MATITSLTFHIFSRYDGGGLRQARRDIDDFNESSKKSTNSLNSWAGRLQLAAKVALTFGPALIPIGAAAVSAGAGLMTMGVTAGVGLGAYGLAIKNAMDEADRFAAAGKRLTASQEAYVNSVEKAKQAMGTFGSSFKTESLKAATATFNGLTNILHGLEPVARAIAPEITKVAQAFEKWTKGSSFREYIQLIKANAVPAIQKLISIGKDVGHFLGEGFKAFLPTGQKVLDVIKNGASSLSKWADGGGFKRFLDYVHQNAPAVKDFFHALGDALTNVGTALKGMGGPALLFTTAILKIIAAAPPGLIQAIAYAWLLWTAAVKGMAIITGIAGGIGALAAAISAAGAAGGIGSGGMTAFAASLLGVSVSAMPLIVTIGLIVLALAAVAVGIYFLVTKWDTVWGFIKQIAGQVWQWLQTAWEHTVGALRNAWNAVSAALRTAWNAVWGGIRTAFNAVVSFLGSKWGWLIALLGPIGWLIAIAMHWKQVWGAIKIAATAVWNALKTAWNAVVHALQTAWNAVSGALRTAWNAVWNAIKAAAVAVWNALKTAWNAVVHALQTAWNTVSGALKNAWNAVWGWIKQTAQRIWDGMKLAWQMFLVAIRTAWNTFSAPFRNLWNAVWGWIKDAAKKVWDWLKQAWQFLLTAIRIGWNNFTSSFRNLWSTAWNWIKDTASKIWDWLKDRWTDFTESIGDLWDQAAELLKKAWDAAWTWLKNTAKDIWDDIKGVIGDAVNICIEIVNGLISAWNAVAGAVSLPKIDPVNKVKFAEGGVAGEKFAGGGVLSGYSPGTDSINAMLSPGEGVLVPEAVAALGSDWVHGANHYFSNGRAGFSSGGFAKHLNFAEGGVVKFAGGGDVPNPTGGMAGQANPNNPNNGGGGSGGSGGMAGDAKKYEKSGTTNSDNPIGGLIGKVAGIGMGMFGLPDIAQVTAAFMKVINAARSIGGFIKPAGGALGDVGMKMLKTIVDKIKDLIKKAAAALVGAGGGSQGGPISGKVGNLRGVVIAALKRAGYPVTEGNINAMLRRIQIESGGNPNAVNRWDSNARAGTPSIGLAQVIGPTFAQYGSGNIYDPVDNVTASLNYIRARYGGRIPTHVGGYAIGTPGATRGWAMVGEQGPEMVNLRGGESITSNTDLARAVRGSGGGPVHIEMPIHVAGNLDKQAVEKLDTEVLPKLRIMLSKGTGSRLS